MDDRLHSFNNFSYIVIGKMSQHHQYINVVAYYLKKTSFFKEFLMDMFSRQYVRWREFSVEDVSTEHSID